MQKIVDALYFAKQCLKIKDKFFDQNFEVLKFSEDRIWIGLFCSGSSIIYFNGYPSLRTIFHEAVHFKQWENKQISNLIIPFLEEEAEKLSILLENQYAKF